MDADEVCAKVLRRVLKRLKRKNDDPYRHTVYVLEDDGSVLVFRDVFCFVHRHYLVVSSPSWTRRFLVDDLEDYSCSGVKRVDEVDEEGRPL